MQRGDRVELFVEKLVFEGAGLARVEDFPVFVSDVAPKEKVLAEIVSVNKNYAKAKLIEVLEASEFRVKPFCAMANVCGGCSWQHVDYEEQLRQKQQIVKETLRKISGMEIEVKDIIPSPETLEYRHKVQYPVAQTKVSKRLLAGYYKKNTHELVNIKHCPIQPAIIDEITEFIREKSSEFGVSAYDEKVHKGELRHIVFRHSEAFNNVLAVFVINAAKPSNSLKRLAKNVFDRFEQVIGVVANFNTKRTNAIMGERSERLEGHDFYSEKLGEKTYQISAGSFFQVNPKSATNILETVKNIIKSEFDAPEILDAYSGVGSFGIYLGDIAKSVICVEDYPFACENAKENIRLNNYSNFEVYTGDAKVHLQNFVENGKTFDVVIVDPPRKGLASEAIETTAKLSKKMVVYVSCNPSTLARDLKLFDEFGFKVQYVQPVDMFCHTFHIENIALLLREEND